MFNLFSMMERYESFWKKVKGSEALKIYGFEGFQEPEPVNVNLEGMIELFKMGHNQFSSLWKNIFCDHCFEEIQKAAAMDSTEFHFSTEAWVQILYELAATYHVWQVNRKKLIDLVTPLYYARVASFVRQSWEPLTPLFNLMIFLRNDTIKKAKVAPKKNCKYRYYNI